MHKNNIKKIFKINILKKKTLKCTNEKLTLNHNN